MSGTWKRHTVTGLFLALAMVAGLAPPAAAAQKDLGALRVSLLPVGDCLQAFVADEQGFNHVFITPAPWRPTGSGPTRS